MPQFTPSHPTKGYKVLGETIQVPQIYAEGHEATADEAKFFNRALATVLVNSFGGDVRRQLDPINKARAADHKAGKYHGPTIDVKNAKGDPTGKQVPAPATAADIPGWDSQSKFLEKFAAYKVGANNRGAGGGLAKSHDPLESIIEDIAVAAVKLKIRKKGLSVQKFMRTANDEHGNELNRLVSEYIAEKRESLEALAKEQMAQTGDDDDDLDLTLPEEADTESQAA